MSEEKVVETLTALGLTLYEAKVFVALTRLGEASVGEVYPQAEVPRSAVYGVLEKLQKKGMIEISHGKPRKYRALSPDIALGKLERAFTGARDFAVEALTKIHNTAPVDIPNDAIWVIKGEKNIDDKIKELIKDTENNVIFGGQVSLITKFSDDLKKAQKRGVNVSFLVADDKPNSDGELERLGKVTYLPIEKMLPGQVDLSILLIDNHTALFRAFYSKSMQAEETAFWSDSVAVISFIEFSLNQLMERVDS
jgi:sugar-specific transcriptional regulator TrmB